MIYSTLKSTFELKTVQLLVRTAEAVNKLPFDPSLLNLTEYQLLWMLNYWTKDSNGSAEHYYDPDFDEQYKEMFNGK